MEWTQELDSPSNQGPKHSLVFPLSIPMDRPFQVTCSQTAQSWTLRFHSRLNVLFAQTTSGPSLQMVEKRISTRSLSCMENKEDGTWSLQGEILLDQCYNFQCRLDPSAFAHSFSTSRKKETGATIKSPMTGTVLSKLCQKGDTVTKGQVLAVVEAMKMENKISANTSGVIQDCPFQVGDKIQSGQIIAVIR